MRNRKDRGWPALGVGGLVIGFVFAAVTLASAQAPAPARAMLRDGFESPKWTWRQEQTDATVEVFAHDRSNRAAHEGVLSERFQFRAGIGGGFFFSYPLPSVPVTDALRVGLYVRSDRAGVQLLARVVLPEDIDPDTAQPSFVLVPGDTYEDAGRWRKLELADLMPAIERQARVIRASTRRPVRLDGAYIERLVVNLYCGQGDTEVFLDELGVGPVAPEVADRVRGQVRAGAPVVPEGSGGDQANGATARPIAATPGPLEADGPGPNARIKYDRGRLTKDGNPWFVTAVRAPGADPAALRTVDIDALVVPRDVDPDFAHNAAEAGMLLIPELAGPGDRNVPDGDRLAALAAGFPERNAVAFWSLGEELGRSTDPAVRDAAKRRVRAGITAIRRAKPGGSPLTTGTVAGLLPEYARVPENLDVIGIPTAGWATAQDPFEMYQFLAQRRLLTARSNNDALFLAHLDAMAPPVYREAIWGSDPPPSWGIPRVQPEQLRIAAYAAIAGGCRGLCFRGDADLTLGLGRAVLLELAFLNEEFRLLEPILGDPDKLIRMTETYFPDPPPPAPITLFQMNPGMMGTRPPTPKEIGPNFTVKAVEVTTKDRRGKLLMVADYYKYAQFQPPQSAQNNVVLLTPAAADAHAYLLSPGGVVPLASKREPGGLRIVLEDFGVTALVLVTTNLELKDQIEQAINANRPRAAALAIEQAEILRAWVVEIDSYLQDRQHPQRNSADLLNQSGELIRSARAALERFDYQTAWDEARRAGRPLRILMRYHFMAVYDRIIKDLNDENLPCGPLTYPNQEKPMTRLIAPTVAPPLASFNTLPQAWQWEDYIKRGRLGPNVVPGGAFNNPDALTKGGWVDESYKLDEIQTTIKLTKGGPDKVEGGSNLFLSAAPKPPLTVDALPPFVDQPLVAVRSPGVKVRAREIYRISVMAYCTNVAAPGAGGLIVRDSIGGERLQYRTTQALAAGWFEIVFYRRVPADGTLSVTLGLAGYGAAAFDDLKIEPIVEQVDLDSPEYAARPRRRPAPTETSATAGNPAAPAETSATATRVQPMPVRQ